jgi:hypothetical protein
MVAICCASGRSSFEPGARCSVSLLIGLLAAVIATAGEREATPRATTPARPQVSEPTPATAVEKIAVFMQSEVHDALGALYVAKFRDALAESSAYRPVPSSADARYVIGFLTMDPNEAEAGIATGHATVAAVTLQREHGSGPNELVYSWVLVAKREKVDALVADLIGAIDQEIRGLEQPTIRFVD